MLADNLAKLGSVAGRSATPVACRSPHPQCGEDRTPYGFGGGGRYGDLPARLRGVGPFVALRLGAQAERCRREARGGRFEREQPAGIGLPGQRIVRQAGARW